MKTTKHFSRTGAIVDLGAIRSNLEAFRGLVKPGTKLLATVKANAYGHGACEVANALAGAVDMFSVACTDEGLELREAGGIIEPILVLGPSFTEDDEDAIAYGLTQTVFTYERAWQLNESARVFFEELDRLEKLQSGEIQEDAEDLVTKTVRDLETFRAGGGDSAENEAKAPRKSRLQEAFETYGIKDRKAHIHIAVDTGMSRIGLSPDAQGLIELDQIHSLPYISIDGIFTHFATADESDKTHTMEALARFRKFREMVKMSGMEIPVWHCANTASIIDGIGLDFDMVRVGIGLYGMYPSEEVKKENVSLKPVLLWYSYLTRVREIEAGTSVSYGYKYTADHKVKVGTVCVGYADGYRRGLSLNGTEVLVNGVRCPVLGSICMDQMMIDVSEVPGATPGTPVILIGAAGKEAITAEELAGRLGTINYEITCGISERVPRKYVG